MQLPFPPDFMPMNLATSLSYQDASGTYFYTAFGKRDGVSGTYVFRYNFQLDQATYVDMGLVPSARGTLSYDTMARALILTAWNGTTLHRLHVPGFLTERLNLPLINP